MQKDIAIDAGAVVAIGKLKVTMSEHFPHEIPTLSFIVARCEDGNFVATCIQLMADGHASEAAEAIHDMADNCRFYLMALFKRRDVFAWNELHDLFKSPMGEYWDAYHDVQLNLAESGVATDGSAIEREYKRQIAELQECIDDLEGELKAYKAGRQTGGVKIVDYQTVEAKAA